MPTGAAVTPESVSIRFRSLGPSDSTAVVVLAMASIRMFRPVVRGVIATRPEWAKTSGAVPVEAMLSRSVWSWISGPVMVPLVAVPGRATSAPAARMSPPGRATVPVVTLIDGAVSTIVPGAEMLPSASTVPNTDRDAVLLTMTLPPPANRPEAVPVEDRTAPCMTVSPIAARVLLPARTMLPAVEVPVSVSTIRAPVAVSRMSPVACSATVLATPLRSRAVLIAMLPAVMEPPPITVPALFTYALPRDRVKVAFGPASMPVSGEPAGPPLSVSIRLRSVVPSDSTVTAAPMALAVASTEIARPALSGVIATMPWGAEISALPLVEAMLSWSVWSWINGGMKLPTVDLPVGCTSAAPATSDPVLAMAPPGRDRVPSITVIAGAVRAIVPECAVSPCASTVPTMVSAAVSLTMTLPPAATSAAADPVAEVMAPWVATLPRLAMVLAPPRRMSLAVPISVLTIRAPAAVSRTAPVAYSAAVAATVVRDRVALMSMAPAVMEPPAITVPRLSTYAWPRERV